MVPHGSRAKWQFTGSIGIGSDSQKKLIHELWWSWQCTVCSSCSLDSGIRFSIIVIRCVGFQAIYLSSTRFDSYEIVFYSVYSIYYCPHLKWTFSIRIVLYHSGDDRACGPLCVCVLRHLMMKRYFYSPCACLCVCEVWRCHNVILPIEFRIVNKQTNKRRHPSTNGWNDRSKRKGEHDTSTQ